MLRAERDMCRDGNICNQHKHGSFVWFPDFAGDRSCSKHGLPGNKGN